MRNKYYLERKIILSHQRVHEIFEKEVRRNADEIAVEFQGKSLTYRQLNQQANQVANGLLKRGVKSGMLVGVCMNRSLEMIVGIIGILKAGALIFLLILLILTSV